MKINTLYIIENSDITFTDANSVTSEATFIISINIKDRIFEGHFPGTPILPGVCTLHIIKDCISRAIGNKVQLSKISQCKFTGMVDPRTDSKLRVQITLQDRINGFFHVNALVILPESERVILKLKGRCSE
jgi:3-hydroxyacyl-[acyl-carrier-protein] dehydratase